MWRFTWTLQYIMLSFILVNHIGGEDTATSGRCYSGAQVQCEHELGHFWAATITNDKSNICPNLQSLQTCIEKAMTTCSFEPHEAELYDSDIVRTYTQPPYSCPLVEGKMETQHSDAHKGSTGTVNRCSGTFLIVILYLVLHGLQL